MLKMVRPNEVKVAGDGNFFLPSGVRQLSPAGTVLFEPSLKSPAEPPLKCRQDSALDTRGDFLT